MMKKIHGNLLVVILMSYALAGCIEYDINPDVPWVEPKAVELSGSGSLKVGYGEDALTTNSTYNWSLLETTLKFDITVDINQYVNGDDVIPGGAFEIGNFTLPTATVNDFTGIFVSELDETTFYAIEPDGAVVAEMTSYKPGMWVDGDGFSGGWSTSAMFWQWCIWEGKTDSDGDVIGYDYSSEDYGNITGLFVIGSNPSNVAAQAGKTVTSKAKIVAGNVTYDWIVNVTFAGEISENPDGGENYPDVPLTGSGYPFPYSAGVAGENQFSWYTDENSVNIFADIYTPTVIEAESFEIMGFVINTEELMTAFGIEAGAWDISTFYPVEPDGTVGTEWTSFGPGQWVAADGSATDWSAGVMFWQYQVGGTYYDGHSTEGLLLIGTNPGNIADLGGETVVSKAKFFGKDWVVTVRYHSSYPTSGSGKVGPHSYTWALSEEGVNIVANCSAALTDESWNWFGFPLNEIYINDYFDINIDELSGTITSGQSTSSTDGFYPVNSEGTRLETWTSYSPGMWFGADGNAWDWGYASWGNYWQYYTVAEHNYAIPNLMLFGNFGNVTYNAPGTSGTSKAILDGTLQWNVTINIVD